MILCLFTIKSKEKNEKIFDNIDSIDDTTFKNWFALDKEQLQTVCSFSVTCQPKHVAVLLCKMRTFLSDKQLSFLFFVGGLLKIIQ